MSEDGEALFWEIDEQRREWLSYESSLDRLGSRQFEALDVASADAEMLCWELAGLRLRNRYETLYTFGEHEIEALDVLLEGGETSVIAAALRAWLGRHPPVEFRDPDGAQLIRAVANALDPKHTGPFKLVLKQRRRGRVRSIQAADELRDIGCAVLEHVQEGRRVEAAVQLVMERFNREREYVYRGWMQVKKLIDGAR